MSKKAKPATASVRVHSSQKAAKTAAASALTQRPNKGGKFSDGVRVVSKRDRAGLIKLADR